MKALRPVGIVVLEHGDLLTGGGGEVGGVDPVVAGGGGGGGQRGGHLHYYDPITELQGRHHDRRRFGSYNINR